MSLISLAGDHHAALSPSTTGISFYDVAHVSNPLWHFQHMPHHVPLVLVLVLFACMFVFFKQQNP